MYGLVHQWTRGAGKFVSCVEVPKQCCSDCALVPNQVALPRSERGYGVIEYEDYPSRSCMRHDQNKFRSVPSKMLICCPRYATNFDLVKVILLKPPSPPLLNLFVAAKPQKIFWEHFFKSKKKWEHFGLVKKKWEQSENIFGEAKKKSENIGETIWAGLTATGKPTVTKAWVRSIYKRLRFKKRKGTKAAKKVPENAVELGDVFFNRIYDIKTQYNIPPSMIF